MQVELQGFRLQETTRSSRISQMTKGLSCHLEGIRFSRGEPSRFKLKSTGQVTRVYIRNGKGAQTRRAQTRRAQTRNDKAVVKVQKRKAREKELSQYESEIRRQCSRVEHVYQDGNEKKWNRTA